MNALVGKALSRDLVTFFEKPFGFIERNRSDNDVRLLDRISRLFSGREAERVFFGSQRFAHTLAGDGERGVNRREEVARADGQAVFRQRKLERLVDLLHFERFLRDLAVGGNYAVHTEIAVVERFAEVAAVALPDSAVKHAVIGQGNGIVSARPDPRGNIPDAAGTVQQTVFTVQVQVDKISHARLLSSLA